MPVLNTDLFNSLHHNVSWHPCILYKVIYSNKTTYSCKDKEEQGQCKVQGSLHQVPVHPGDQWQWEGREVETVSAPWFVLYSFLFIKLIVNLIN